MYGEKFKNILIITNPIFWVVTIPIILFELPGRIINLLGISDWYFALFKIHKLSIEERKSLLKRTSVKQKRFYIKQKAWDYASKKLESLNKQ